jgi:nucleotide-binding universal stress UspA family protein
MMFKHILFATDGTEASDHAASIAVDLARSHGAALAAVFVIDPSPKFRLGKTNPWVHVANLATTGGTHVPFKTLLVEDRVAYKGIVQAAEVQNADLIVVGSHQRKSLQGRLLGSTANKVLSHAKQPVLIVR